MKRWAEEKRFPFKYLYDESQEVARAYDAVCTPDFFGYDAELGLQYRGRLDESRAGGAARARRELFEAMRQVAVTGHGPAGTDPVHGLLDQVEAGSLRSFFRPALAMLRARQPNGSTTASTTPQAHNFAVCLWRQPVPS